MIFYDVLPKCCRQRHQISPTCRQRFFFSSTTALHNAQPSHLQPSDPLGCTVPRDFGTEADWIRLIDAVTGGSSPGGWTTWAPLFLLRILLLSNFFLVVFMQSFLPVLFLSRRPMSIMTKAVVNKMSNCLIAVQWLNPYPPDRLRHTNTVSAQAQIESNTQHWLVFWYLFIIGSFARNQTSTKYILLEKV